MQDKSDIAEDVTAAAKENQLPEYPESSLTSDDPSKESVTQSDGIIGIQSTETVNARMEEGYHHASTSTQTSPDENGMKNIQPEQLEIQEMGRREVLMNLPRLDIHLYHSLIH